MAKRTEDGHYPIRYPNAAWMNGMEFLHARRPGLEQIGAPIRCCLTFGVVALVT